jgi:integrase/recombinase XerC
MDRNLWAGGLAAPSSLDHVNVREWFQPATIAKAEEGYGRWLGYLVFINDLDPIAHPADRVTVTRIQAFFDHLRALGNQDHTLVGRMDELTRALKIMAPEREFGWLLKPGGVLLRSRLPMTSRALFVPDAAELYRWGFEIAEAGLLAKGDRRRQVAVRDGAMIAILASRAPRLSALRLMQLDRNLFRNGTRWRLAFSEDEVKNHRAVEYDLPQSLTELMDRYVKVERAQLLAGRESPWVWINWSGELMGEMGIQKRIMWHSEKKFGQKFCPHRFRHAIGTTFPDADPRSDGVAASLLGISTRVLDRHYDRGTQVRAARELQRNLERERQETAGRASRGFKGS